MALLENDSELPAPDSGLWTETARLASAHSPIFTARPANMILCLYCRLTNHCMHIIWCKISKQDLFSRAR